MSPSKQIIQGLLCVVCLLFGRVQGATSLIAGKLSARLPLFHFFGTHGFHLIGLRATHVS